MKAWLLQLWNDPAYFTAAVRGLVVTLGQLITQGVIVVPGGLGKIAWFVAQAAPLVLVVPAGESNPEPPNGAGK